jgi:ligand-binding SRPBCC domain-containing protein
MKIVIETRVEADYLTVKEKFDENLFKALSPSFPKVKVVLFEGSSTGDKVSLEMDLLLFKQRWVSIIVDDATDEHEFFFIDEGEELPFFLGSWRHKHRVIKVDKGSVIRDEIQYTGRYFWMTPLLYPVLYAQFANRGPIYKKYFKK